jgi:hypothetical protein
MNIISEHKERLDNLAAAYAEDFYKDMQNPEMCGPNFKWENFPAFVGRMVWACAFASFSDEEFQPDYKDYAQKKAEEYARELIKKEP